MDDFFKKLPDKLLGTGVFIGELVPPSSVFLQEPTNNKVFHDSLQ